MSGCNEKRKIMIEIPRLVFFGACLISAIAGALLMYSQLDIRRWLDEEESH